MLQAEKTAEDLPAYARKKAGQPRVPVRQRKAGGEQSLQEIFAASDMNKDIWPSVAILNGTELGASPAKGKLVKIVH